MSSPIYLRGRVESRRVVGQTGWVDSTAPLLYNIVRGKSGGMKAITACSLCKIESGGEES